MTDYSIDIIKDTSYTIELNEQGPQGIQGERGIQGPQGPVGPKGDKGDVGEKGDTGVSVVGVEEISKVGLVTTYRMEFSDGTHFDYQVTDGSIDGLTRETIINIIGYEPASYTSVEGLTTRVSTLEERVEDLTTAKFPNVVVIGSPSIEGGQVSGFSNTNYLQFPFVDISRGLPFDIYFSFTTGSDVATQQNILDSYFGIALAIQNGKGVMALSSNGTSWDIGNVTGTNTILPNTTYYVKCGWTGTQYNASLSTNDTTYVPDMVLDSTLTTNKTTIFIGGSPDLFGADSSHPFKGSINFNKSRVDVQGVTVWEGMADVGLASRANVSLNNLDEVGEKRFTDIQIALDGKQDKGTSGSGLEICDIGMTLYVDETKGLRRYLNGQIVDINTNTQAFLDRLKKITTLHPSLLFTEEEWQTAKTMSAFGQVGKFVFNYSGDNIVSVRLPRVVNIQGLFDLQNLGMTVSAGLPNIKTNGIYTRGNMWSTYPYEYTNGPFHGKTDMYYYNIASDTANSYDRFIALDFNASRSNPIYGNSTTVQQEAIQYPYFIQIATGQETENNIINEIELNNPYSLFDIKYSDHELNNLSWLKSEGQWNAKAVYPTAYDELLTEYNNSASTTETEGSITFKRTPKGYKIALADQETAIDTKYTTHGIAWYYILDTANKKFKLPRTKFGFKGLRNNVGNDIAESLPNITGEKDLTWDTVTGIAGSTALSDRFSTTGVFDIKTRDGSIAWANADISSTNVPTILTFDASRSSSTYQNGAPVQERATQMYLYFYVGETVQNANLIDAGRIGEILPTKTDMQQAAKASMPSDRYIDLAVGASGTTYTAPADGYYSIDALTTGQDAWLRIEDQNNGLFSNIQQHKSGYGFENWLIAKKGHSIRIEFAFLGINRLRFIYAEGAQ